MTRENKLVMVIGFGLLLFVGILVSDHLSARDSQFAQPDSIVDVKLDQVRQLPVAEEERLKSFGQPERGAEGAAEIDGRRVVILPPVEPNGGVGGGVAPPVPQPPAPEPVRTHTIAKGDNPEKIAQKYYNKRSLASKLAEYNNIDPAKLKIGQTLKIPDIGVLDPKAVAVQQPQSMPQQMLPQVQEQQQARVEPRVAPEPRVSEPRARTVKVQKGDSLWKIAERAYGKASNAKIKELQQLNPGLNEKNLKIGSEIKVAAAS
jgi:nucleoid-associated protein YgaU